MLCYCKSGQLYDRCCGLIITGQMCAPTSEALMRSRYSAFVIADVEYLMRTHHSSTRPVKEKKAILKWTKSVTWMGLQIIRTKAGKSTDDEGWVEFRASYLENGSPQCIHENSYFVKEKGVWYYKSGVHD